MSVPEGRPRVGALTTKPRRSADRTSKHPDAVLVSYGDMAYSDEWGYWRGTLTGDVRGKAEFREQPKNFEKDGIEYYFEDFVIRTHDGVLRGTKNGVYDLTTGDFWDHGRVAEATGRWAPLRGYLVFERATTTTPGVFPMIGHHTPMLLVPPHPTASHDDRTLICHTDAAFRGERRGTLTGDLRGNIEFRRKARTYAIGDTEYFSETFSITAREGTFHGTETGECDRTIGDFWSCGQVTETSGPWDRLMGARTLRWGRASGPRGQPTKARPVPFILAPVRAG